METLTDRVLSNIKDNRNNILQGQINCIPSPFTCFTEDLIGIQQSTYYLITSQQKGAKTQFGSYFFIFNPILYAYNHQDQVSVKVFYYPLEETPEKVILRFMSYLLYSTSGGKIQVSINDLRSLHRALDPTVISLLESSSFKKVLAYFESCVYFQESTTVSACYDELNKYAKTHGTVHNKTLLYKDTVLGEDVETQVFDYYEPYNPKEYVIIFYDHIGLINPEQGSDLRQTIAKHSKNMIELKNRYHYIPVIIQQQSYETQSLDAFKNNKIRPSVAGLAECKNTSKDCDIMLGIANPSAFDIPDYLGYDITKLRGNIRFLEVVLNRWGLSNGVLPMFFNGKCCYFTPMPASNNYAALEKLYKFVN